MYAKNYQKLAQIPHEALHLGNLSQVVDLDVKVIDGGARKVSQFSAQILKKQSIRVYVHTYSVHHNKMYMYCTGKKKELVVFVLRKSLADSELH